MNGTTSIGPFAALLTASFPLNMYPQNFLDLATGSRRFEARVRGRGLCMSSQTASSTRIIIPLLRSLGWIGDLDVKRPEGRGARSDLGIPWSGGVF